MSQLAQRLIMAAGGAKKDPTYIDDVFSTYLYKGNDDNVVIGNDIKLSNANGGYGVAFNSSQSDGINSAGSDGFGLGTGDFTVEHWLYTDFSTASQQVIDGRDYGASGDSNWATSIHSSGNEYRFFAVEPGLPGAARISNNTTLNANTWYHIAIVRSSGTTKMYIDGVQQTQTFADSNNYNNTTLTLGIHGPNQSSFPFNGKLSNVRVVKGTAVYTSNFTPPTENLTNISGTELLCCQSSATPITTTVDSSTLLYMINTPVLSSGPFTGEDAKGGLVWIKNRDTSGYGHFLFDTERGTTKAICTNLTNAQFTEVKGVNSFNTDGFTAGGSGGDTAFNANNVNYASWTFAKQEGFFDIVTWTGNNTQGRTIPHNLGSIPGTIIVKCTSTTGNWPVHHTSVGAGNCINLNTTGTSFAATNRFGDVLPTASVFTVGSDADVNAVGETYVAYIFAGGASDQPGSARSVAFAGTGNNQSGNDYLSLASSSDFEYGTGDFTIEAWLKPDTTAADQVFLNHGSDNPMLGILNGKWQYYNATVNFKYAGTPCRGAWTHFAVSRSSGTTRFFINGQERNSWSDSHNYGAQVTSIGAYATGTYGWNGGISNVRIVKGTAVYTESFIPPTQGLTNITNTKLLCCNKNTVTGSTVTPGTITSNGSPQSSTITPFDDLEGYKFGEGGDQNLIKCGSFKGAGSAAVDVNIGWEPSWVMIKNASATENWFMFDNMRGVVAEGNDNRLQADNTGAEFTTFDYIEFNSTGFKVNANATAGVNGSGNTMIFVAIRRVDGYVGKPPAVGKDAFTMDTGTASSTVPNFYSEFPVDFTFAREYNGVANWDTTGRLIQGRMVRLNTNAAGMSATSQYFDSNIGWNKYSGWTWNSQSWMWRRGAGLDVVTYKGQSPDVTQFKHNLNKVPEMMWVKHRDATGSWQVYHKGINDGTNPQNYYLELNQNYGQDTGTRWNNTAPTSTYFSVGQVDTVNGAASNNYDYIAMLFASVDGISKVGYYDGSATSHTITTGFQPRMVIIKEVSSGSAQSWWILDTFRGWGAGNDNGLQLNATSGPTSHDFGAPTATGFELVGGHDGSSNVGKKYIYYAHA